MKTLIIGGHHDGERVNVEGRRTKLLLRVRLTPNGSKKPVRSSFSAVQSEEMVPIMAGFTMLEYRLREFHSSSGNVTLYAHPSLSDKGVMQRLMAGYNPITANERQ